MANIKITKGLNIPIRGKPEGMVHLFNSSSDSSNAKPPKLLACDLKPFEESKLRLLAKVDDYVKTGQPLAEDKTVPGRMWASPACGTIREIRRGLKRVLQTITIETAEKEEFESYPVVELKNSSKKDVIELLMRSGLFTRIRSRPFDLLANPHQQPKAIFVKALESAPFAPPSEMQVEGQEKAFQEGLNALSLIADGKVHLVMSHDTTYPAFINAENVIKHTAEGPHPIANPSLHIQEIAPIRSLKDIIWTLNAHTVVAIGYLLLKGQYFTERVISIAGPGVLSGRTGYFKVREGFPIAPLISGRIPRGLMRFISGDPLNGQRVSAEDFLGCHDYVLSVIPENVQREFMHFFKLGLNKYSFSKAYLSGHLSTAGREYDFTTNQHGERRAFVDPSLYNEVTPLHVPTMPFIKALMAEDFDSAEELGILEVSPEDFALPTFVCPSKIEMVDIVKKALSRYSKDVLQ
ncbi:Na(+)-translocating NADH-quinone reductase subunit A [Chlamydiales bacterium STE3]|nr:Na(+)-translocating NADH-quinone reductase subunit A [Chlamydiales bacterium STE3]